MNDSLPPNAPLPRLCHVKKRADFSGYGFNLHAEKGRSGQFIGKVDDDSPASDAGLLSGDRIVEVNGTNIGNENHQQVVQRIKAVENETRLLVVDHEADEYYKKKKIVIRAELLDKGSSPLVNGTSASAATHSGRSCHLKIWPNYSGYGFNLVAEKGKVGQFIGKVDSGSPAELSGLQEGDRIVGINGKPVASADHAQVVEMIKSTPNHTRLLVVDKAADAYFKSKNITLTENSSYVIKLECPDSKPSDSFPPSPSISAAATSSPVSASESSEFQPRLCHLKKWPDFSGYGFNLHAEKGKPGQYIGKVETESPALLAGLRESDLIIEINGQNIMNKKHQEVIDLVRSNPSSCKMLVVDPNTFQHYKNLHVDIHSGMSNIKVITCPDDQPSTDMEVPTYASVVHSSAASERPVESGPSPRLCLIRKWADFDGFGFNLNAEKGKPGQYIGSVESQSPAELGGLRTADLIVEVNDASCEGLSHADVVQLIRADPQQVSMLVVDPDTAEYYRSREVKVSAQMSNIERCVCPESRDAAEAEAVVAAVAAVDEATSEHDAATSTPTPPPPRHCLLRRWTDYSPGYGFSITSDPAGAPVISELVSGSPADLAGLRLQDRLLAVNDVMLEPDATHDDVVRRVRERADSVRLLVASARTIAAYEAREESIKVQGADVVELEAPADRPSLHEVEQEVSAVEVAEVAAVVEAVNTAQPEPTEPETFFTPTNNEPEPPPPAEPEPTKPTEPEPIKPSEPEPAKPAPVGGLEFPMSVEEARKKISGKKKRDPRQASMNMRDKYELFKQL